MSSVGWLFVCGRLISKNKRTHSRSQERETDWFWWYGDLPSTFLFCNECYTERRIPHHHHHRKKCLRFPIAPLSSQTVCPDFGYPALSSRLLWCLFSHWTGLVIQPWLCRVALILNSHCLAGTSTLCRHLSNFIFLHPLLQGTRHRKI